MYEAVLADFLTWARSYDVHELQGRSRARHEEWLAGLSCPILRLDASHPREALRDQILMWNRSPPERTHMPVVSMGQRNTS